MGGGGCEESLPCTAGEKEKTMEGGDRSHTISVFSTQFGLVLATRGVDR